MNPYASPANVPTSDFTRSKNRFRLKFGAFHFTTGILLGCCVGFVIGVCAIEYKYTKRFPPVPNAPVRYSQGAINLLAQCSCQPSNFAQSAWWIQSQAEHYAETEKALIESKRWIEERRKRELERLDRLERERIEREKHPKPSPSPQDPVNPHSRKPRPFLRAVGSWIGSMAWGVAGWMNIPYQIERMFWGTILTIFLVLAFKFTRWQSVEK